MADLDYDGFGADVGEAAYDAPSGGFGRILNMIGAVASVALIAGLGVWGYKLLVRDVTGVPVVRAIEGPMRVQPQDPGGQRAAHQGLAVNRVAAVGEAAPPAEEIVLAPRSADLEPEDLPVGLLTAAPAIAPVKPEPAVAEVPADPLEAAILAATTQVLTAEAELSGEGLIDVIPASVPGPSRSLRPRARPEGLSVARAAPPSSTDGGASADVVDPASLAPGTRLVQFGAFDTRAEATAAWTALGERFGALMEGKGLVIEEAATGGRTFFRLRAEGFEDLADARRFCAAFVAERADCIPVVTR